MRRLPFLLIVAAALVCTGCRHAARPADGSVVFLIESSPTNLDPRIGLDVQSQHIDELIFDGLVTRDSHFQFGPGLAQSWEQPDPLTLIFHLRPNVHFQDGRPLTSRDVLFTINSMRDGTVISAKAASYAAITRMEAPDPNTVVMHLSHPDNFLMINLSTGAIGIVPDGSGRDFSQHPVGSGPFRFVSQEIDKEVVLDRNPGTSAPDTAPHSIQHLRFAVVPDAVTRALELRKGSADIASNSIPADAPPVPPARLPAATDIQHALRWDRRHRGCQERFNAIAQQRHDELLNITPGLVGHTPL